MSRTFRRRPYSFFRQPRTQRTRRMEHSARWLMVQEGFGAGIAVRHPNRLAARGNPGCPYLPTSHADLPFASREPAIR